MRMWLGLALAGCAGDATEEDRTCTVSAEAGQMELTLDGEAWASDATWSEAGDGVQVISTLADGWRFTIVAQQALTEVEVGSFPVEIDLSVDAGFITAYPESGDASFSSSGGSGTLTLTDREDDLLSGCFQAELGSGDGGVLVVEDGGFVAERL